jgi:ricin-type beta-trefoil lectin protein
MPTWTATARQALPARRARPVALLLLAGGLALLGAAPASASLAPSPDQPMAGPIVSGYRATKCVDDLGDSSVNGTPAAISDCSASPEQAWTFAADGTVQINGKCLDVFRQGVANKTKVEVWTCNGGANQQWTLANGTIVNPVSGKCLDDPQYNTTNGTQLIIYTCNAGRNQQWLLPQVGS